LKEPIIQINNFSGGMTLNEKMGREDQFHIGKGLDFFSKLGYLTAGYAWRNMSYNASESLPAQFPWMLFANKDSKNYFGGDDNKIYRQKADDNTVIELANTALASIRGMAEYKDYLYYAQDTNLGRFNFDATWTNNWQTLNTTTYHPMVVMALKLWIGNGQYVAMYDGTTWNNNVLDLDTGWAIRCLAPFGTFLAVGANFGNVKGKIFLWNRTDASWNEEIDIPENSVQAMIYYAGYLWIWAGTSANLYVVAEGTRKAVKIFSFVRENPQQDLIVYPGAVAIRKGAIYFGLSNVDSTSKAKNPSGVYSFPYEPSEFKLNIPLRVSDYNEKIQGLAIMGTTNTLYVSYRNEVSVGAEYNNLKREKTIDESAPYSSTAEYESRQFRSPKNKKILTEKCGITCDPLPAGVNLSLYYKKDNEADWTAIFSDFNTANAIEKKVDKRIECFNIKFKLELRGSITTSNRPFVESIYATGDFIEKP